MIQQCSHKQLTKRNEDAKNKIYEKMNKHDVVIAF
jgi:hypothetical protein